MSLSISRSHVIVVYAFMHSSEQPTRPFSNNSIKPVCTPGARVLACLLRESQLVTLDKYRQASDCASKININLYRSAGRQVA